MRKRLKKLMIVMLTLGICFSTVNTRAWADAGRNKEEKESY